MQKQLQLTDHQKLVIFHSEHVYTFIRYTDIHIHVTHIPNFHQLSRLNSFLGLVERNKNTFFIIQFLVFKISVLDV